MRERRQQLSSSTFLVPKHPGKDYVALCVIARDAHADVLEWLNHHIRCVGVCNMLRMACLVDRATGASDARSHTLAARACHLGCALSVCPLQAACCCSHRMNLPHTLLLPYVLLAGWAWARCICGTMPATRR